MFEHLSMETLRLARLEMSMLVHPFLSDSEKGWGLSWYGEELNLVVAI
jgi:hypothetical protein